MLIIQAAKLGHKSVGIVKQTAISSRETKNGASGGLVSEWRGSPNPDAGGTGLLPIRFLLLDVRMPRRTRISRIEEAEPLRENMELDSPAAIL